MFNLVGILPFSFTATGSLAAPFCFSLTMFFLCFITATMRGGLAAVAGFLPTGTERTIAPLVILIEVVSNFAKFVSLGVRLFANMFAGHLLLKVFYSICFQVAASINFFLVLPEVMTGAFVFFVVALEVMIAFLQAFVFILLSILYLKEAENFLAAH
jgi:F-type H+-transporting ATPase subunit a